MNTIKTVKKDVAQSISNVATAGTGLVKVTTSVVSDATGIVAGTVEGLPGVLSALWYTPKNAMVGYIKEAEDCSLEEAQKKVDEMLPDSVADAITAGAIGAGELTALLLEDDEEVEDEKDKQAA